MSRPNNNASLGDPFDEAVLERATHQACRYRIAVEPEPDGYGGTVAEMPNIYGFGETPDACRHETHDLLVTALATKIERAETR